MPGKRALAEPEDTIRKRRRTRREAGAQSSHASHLASTLDFHGVWRELTAAGWTYKLPRGLDNRYRYILPGCTANGREGHDFLLGEEAVLSYFVQHCNPQVAHDGEGLQHTDSSTAPVAAPGGSADDRGVVDVPSGGRGDGAAGGRLFAGRGRGGRVAAVTARGGRGGCVAFAKSRGGGGTVVGAGRGCGGGAESRLPIAGRGEDGRSAPVQARGVGDDGVDIGGVVDSPSIGRGEDDCAAHMAARGGGDGGDDGGSADASASGCGGRDWWSLQVPGRGARGAWLGEGCRSGEGSSGGQPDTSQSAHSGSVETTPIRQSALCADRNNATPPASTGTATSTTFRNRTPTTPNIVHLLLKQMVAFSPSKEPWMQNHKTKIYRCVGTSYIVGRVCRRVKKLKNGAILQVMWLDTQFQNAVEALTIATVQRGIDNYQVLMRIPNKPALTDTVVEGELNLDLPLDELEIASDGEDYELWDPERLLPASLSEVEAVKSMRFEPELETEGPGDLYHHSDDSNTSRLLPEYSQLFAHSASSSFFAYIPVYFWKQVVLETNQYAAAKEIRITKPFTMG